MNAAKALLISYFILQPQELRAQDSPALKRHLFERINHDRGLHGLPSVKFHAKLSNIADRHCEEMLKEKYTSHWARSGLKPYMRYSLGGITAHTEENIATMWRTPFRLSPEALEREITERHMSLLNEKPPADGHRRSILGPHHTDVGIGLAYDSTGLALIEVYSDDYVRLEPTPSRARLSDRLKLNGMLSRQGFVFEGVSIYFEPLPRPLSVAKLEGTGAYSLPDELRTLRPILPNGYRYEDGESGTVTVRGGEFTCPLRFLRKEPGVYTIGVFIKENKRGAESFLVTNLCIFVE
jgi:uncharacterized protein YkwD